MKYNHIFLKGSIYLSCLKLTPTPFPNKSENHCKVVQL